ncbi:MAG: hypothetical protein ABSA77_07390 [Thermoguttaceae bacterium]|jgi:hypothetical protein
MFSFIFSFSASQSSDFSSSWEWWSVHLIIPAMLTILTGAATFILLWYRLSKTEFYRRLSRGEPYSQELWTRQIVLYVSVCKIAREAFEDVYSFVWHKKQDDQDNEEIKNIPECFNKLESIWADVSILLSPSFNKVYSDFVHQLGIFMTFIAASSGDQELLKNAHECQLKTQKLCDNLLDEARHGVGTIPLDDKIREAIGQLRREDTEKRLKQIAGGINADKV